MLQYKVAKEILAKYVGTAGRCKDSKAVDLFVKEVLQYLLIKGTHGNERKFVFHAQNGIFTLPKELEVPLKIRIDGAVGTVWNRWFEYHSGVDLDKCLPYNGFFEDPNLYPTVYDLPAGGGYPAVVGTCDEDPDAHVIVKGVDLTGREIFTTHRGEKIVGVYLSIKKNVTVASQIRFAKITEVATVRTNGPKRLMWVTEDRLGRGFLAEYDPYEESPQYRRVCIRTPCPPICRVSVIGRIRVKDYYADEDLIPFDNILILTSAGQTVQSMHNTAPQVAQVQQAMTEGLIENEGNYKKASVGQPVEIWKPKSGGVIKNARYARSLRRVR